MFFKIVLNILFRYFPDDFIRCLAVSDEPTFRHSDC